MMYVHRLNGVIIGSGASPQTNRSPEVADENNAEWAAYSESLGKPTEVSRAQGKVALIQAGHWSNVVAFVDAIPDPTTKALAEVALYDTTNWQRNSPFLSTAAASLDISESELDQLFLVASQIQL